MSKESQVINLVCDFFMATPVSPENGLSCQEQVMLRLCNDRLRTTTDKGENIAWKIMSRLLRLIMKGR